MVPLAKGNNNNCHSYRPNSNRDDRMAPVSITRRAGQDALGVRDVASSAMSKDLHAVAAVGTW
ncbi:hypothetical protein MCOR05_002677 [Pyricularia oryzae]|nr:hypothetical protein MCOR13_008638 [Pyricularia oryzae]KAI6544071.1 hypothetical protein MCOR05_002677 [Pyricularia oryzae]